MGRTGGFWGMPCWNGLSDEQQKRLIEVGNLPIGWTPEGKCPRPADLCIESRWDAAPGPKFVCLPCALEALKELMENVD